MVATTVDLAALIPLAEVPKLLPPSGRKPGVKVHRATLHRWIIGGVRGRDGSVVKLTAYRIGGCWFTTMAAVEAFVAAVSDDGGTAPAVRSPAQRRRAAEGASRALSEMGC